MSMAVTRAPAAPNPGIADSALTGRPGFLEGAAVALALSLAGAAAQALLRVLLLSPRALPLTLALVGLGYLLYLLHRAGRGPGRISALLLWLVATAGTLVAAPGLIVPLQLLLLWAVRALYFQRGPVAALLDLGLVGLGAGAGLWALGTSGSLAMTLWCFFLVQALFTSIPAARPDAAGDGAPDDRFAHAERIAAASLRRLSRRP
jgi:hypothetical protein